MGRVVLNNVTKIFDNNFIAVNELDLTIRDGELFTLLGPSGCGKTTTLRMIAGLNQPTSGQIELGGVDATRLPANKRGIGMVFQNYALFPHMTVFENVAFGLKARGINKAVVAEKVNNALALVKLEELGNRKPSQLSGGQQQRVALARAVVIEPQVLLLDEPLSNLDAKLRESTRTELKNLQRKLKITTIYVTHDQLEAMALSDRIAVLNHGVCQQVGAPREIYFQPANGFVIRFIGQANLIAAHVIASKPILQVQSNDGVTFVVNADADFNVGDRVVVSFHPETISIMTGESAESENIFEAQIRTLQFTGSSTIYELSLASHIIRASVLSKRDQQHFERGDLVKLHIPPDSITILRD